jgi:hypothetical protein
LVSGFFWTFALLAFGSTFLDLETEGLLTGFSFLPATAFTGLVSFLASAFFTTVFLAAVFGAALLALGRDGLVAGFFSATFFAGLTSCVFWAGLSFALPTAGLVLVAAMVSSSGQDINPCQVPQKRT